jgi:thiosulfate dehydrogenase [quinone] large subunit
VSPSAPTASATPAGAASTESTPAAAHTALPGRHIVAASAVPVGRSFRFTAPDGSPAWLVNTRSRGFRAFSAVCTHAGCTVGLSGNTFVCPCHGGEYDATTGAVVAGPPPSPLRQYDVRVVDGDVRLI